MADYFTHFSCLFDLGTPQNAARALDLYNDAHVDDDDNRLCDGFVASRPVANSAQLWIRDESGGDPERVVAFVLLCANAFELKGLWGFEYANTCSRHLLDGFGGGAVVIDLAARQLLSRTNTSVWLATALEGGARHA